MNITLKIHPSNKWVINHQAKRIFHPLLFQISGLIRNPKVREMELLRLVLLYCICYEGQSGHNPRQFIEAIRNRGVSEAKCKVRVCKLAVTIIF